MPALFERQRTPAPGLMYAEQPSSPGGVPLFMNQGPNEQEALSDLLWRARVLELLQQAHNDQAMADQIPGLPPSGGAQYGPPPPFPVVNVPIGMNGETEPRMMPPLLPTPPAGQLEPLMGYFGKIGYDIAHASPMELITAPLNFFGAGAGTSEAPAGLGFLANAVMRGLAHRQSRSATPSGHLRNVTEETVLKALRTIDELRSQGHGAAGYSSRTIAKELKGLSPQEARREADRIRRLVSNERAEAWALRPAHEVQTRVPKGESGAGQFGPIKAGDRVSRTRGNDLLRQRLERSRRRKPGNE